MDRWYLIGCFIQMQVSRITLRLSGSPTQLRLKVTRRRVRSKRLFDCVVAYQRRHTLALRRNQWLLSWAISF